MKKYVFVLAVILAVSIFLSIRPAGAFYPNIHVQIDNKAFETLNFPSSYRKPIHLGNVQQDVYFFKPEYHGDRNAGESHETAFNRTRDYIISQRQIILNYLQQGEAKRAAFETGKALHAIQDFYSHSNFVELNETDRTKAKAALTDAALRIPSNLKMCGYWTDPPLKPLPCSDEGGLLRPEDPLKYSHTDHNKDVVGQPIGRPNDYGWANGNATLHTEEYIRQIWNMF